jgi:hypothetical protein
MSEITANISSSLSEKSHTNFSIVIPELSGSKIRKTEDGRFSVYDLIRIVGGKKNPRQNWYDLCGKYLEVVGKTDNFQFIGAGQRLTPVANVDNCLYIIGLLPGVCGQTYREKAASIVRRYIEGDADLGLEMIYRDHNKERVDRAKKRLLVCDTNKQVADLAINHKINPGVLHNDRYRGLYRRTAKQLREAAGLSDRETPLDSLSARDNGMNWLANQLAVEANNPDLLFEAANGIRNLYQQTTGKVLEPIFEPQRIRATQAKSIAFGSTNQLELPVTQVKRLA